MDQSLFGDEPESVPVESAPTPIRDWQVELLRKALDSRGLSTMAERQLLIEQLAGRHVDSLRALEEAEALLLLSKLGSAAPTTSSESLWDSRSEDTWIDRL